MKSKVTTALLLIGVLGLLGVVGPALDAEPQKQEQQERSFTQKAADQCGNADWLLNEHGDVVCQKRKPLNMKRVKL